MRVPVSEANDLNFLLCAAIEPVTIFLGSYLIVDLLVIYIEEWFNYSSFSPDMVGVLGLIGSRMVSHG
jgi:hypothetical protein